MTLQQIQSKLQYYKCFTDEKSRKIVKLLRNAEQRLKG